MKLLDVDLDDLKDFRKITREEARRFLETGRSVMCQVYWREIQELSNIRDLEAVQNLETQGIYNTLVFYIDVHSL